MKQRGGRWSAVIKSHVGPLERSVSSVFVGVILDSGVLQAACQWETKEKLFVLYSK